LIATTVVRKQVATKAAATLSDIPDLKLFFNQRYVKGFENSSELIDEKSGLN
jgi:hypothetical protein